MKINLNWLKDHLDWTAFGADNLIEVINRQLGEIEAVIDLKKKYAGAQLVKVEKVEKIKKARQALSQVRLATGQGSAVVVCGAPNVAVGQTVVWLAPKTTLPTSPADSPIILETKEIAGVKSQGMIASGFELGLNNDQDNILVIDESFYAESWDDGPKLKKAKIGQSLGDYLDFGLLIEIENKMFTHRPDCFGLLGVARELGAIIDQPLVLPSWYDLKNLEELPKSNLKLRVETPTVVRLQAGLATVKKVQPSALAVQSRLASVGLRPINSLVDVTNYLMHLTAQPSHVFDYDYLASQAKEVEQPSLVGRTSQTGDQLKLLDGQELQFTSQTRPATLIASDKNPVALAGIMGGQASAVSLASQRVVLEVASFDRADIWPTMRDFGLSSLAGTCFSKGQNPYQTAIISRQGLKMLAEVGGGQVVGLNDSWSKKETNYRPLEISLSSDLINRRLGENIPKEVISRLLKAVSFDPLWSKETKTEPRLTVRVPFWRTDLAIAEDIIEEIGRLYGYEKIQPKLNQRSTKPAKQSPKLIFSQKIRETLASLGANEVLGYSFVSDKDLKAANQEPSQSLEINRPLNPNLSHYRQSLLPGLLKMAKANNRGGIARQAIFEIGFSHLRNSRDDQEIPLDLARLGLVASIDKSFSASFYASRRYLDFLAKKLGFLVLVERFKKETLFFKEGSSLLAPFDSDNRAAIKVGDSLVGAIGQLDGHFAGFEINLDLLRGLIKAQSNYQPLGRYPSSYQDLTLRFGLDQDYGPIYQSLSKQLAAVGREKGYRWQLALQSIYQPKDQPQKQICWRLTLASDQKTLTKVEVGQVKETLLTAANQLGGQEVV